MSISNGWSKGIPGEPAKIERFRSMNSFVCGCCGAPLFDQRLIPLGFAGSFAAGRGQEIAKVGAVSLMAILQQLRFALDCGAKSQSLSDELV